MKLEDLYITNLMKLCLSAKHEPKSCSAYWWYYRLYDGKWDAHRLTSCCMSTNPIFLAVPDIENPFERYNYILNKYL